MSDENVLKISIDSNPEMVARAIAYKFEAVNDIQNVNTIVELRAMGSSASYVALKSVIYARGLVAPKGINLVCIPAYGEVTDNDGTRKVVMRIILKPEF